jgi:Protein of unknown function (DUF2541)
MRSTLSLRLGTLAAIFAVTATSASAAELLGCRKVGFLTDRDVIEVGKADGRFSAIKLQVKENAIEMLDLKVVYGNGNPDDLQVRSEIAAGGETRWIDLKGNKRFIKQINMVYRSKPNFRGQATVCAYGR